MPGSDCGSLGRLHSAFGNWSADIWSCPFSLDPLVGGLIWTSTIIRLAVASEDVVDRSLAACESREGAITGFVCWRRPFYRSTDRTRFAQLDAELQQPAA